MADRSPDPTSNNLVYAVGAGLLMMVILNASAFVTNDDYYVGNSASLYRDGRFLAGLTYQPLRAAFGPDVNFRLFIAFAMGVIGFFAMMIVGRRVINDRQNLLTFAAFALTIFGAAEIMFFYDITPLYYVLTLPAIVKWVMALDRYAEARTRKQAAIFFLVSILCLAVCLATFQVIFYLPFLLLAAYLFVADKKVLPGVLLACILTTVAFFIALIATQLFVRSQLYVDVFGHTLRERAAGHLVGDGTLQGFLSAWVKEAIKLPIYAGNTIALHGFLLAFIFFRSIRRDHWQNLSLALRFLLLLAVLWLSPFLLFQDMVTNGRVMTTVYVFGSIALFLIAFVIINDDRPGHLLTATQAIALALITLAAVAPFVRVAEMRLEVYVAIGCLLLTAIAIPAPALRSAAVLLPLSLATFTALELRKAKAITDRYERFAMIDDLISTKLSEAILNNVYAFNSVPITIEFGLWKDVPRGSFRSFSYSTPDYWRERLWDPSLAKFKRNDALCSGIDHNEIFKVIESAPGRLKLCI